MTDDVRVSRRNVLRWTGVAATVAVAGVLFPNFGINEALAADLGSGDVGVLNYAYALEQLEAAFYTQVVSSPYSGISDAELGVLTEIRDHESPTAISSRRRLVTPPFLISK